MDLTRCVWVSVFGCVGHSGWLGMSLGVGVQGGDWMLADDHHHRLSPLLMPTGHAPLQRHVL